MNQKINVSTFTITLENDVPRTNNLLLPNCQSAMKVIDSRYLSIHCPYSAEYRHSLSKKKSHDYDKKKKLTRACRSSQHVADTLSKSVAYI